ncbi:MAG: DNA cytosine methyltransferase [Lachnospiraceae bacterium]|nr:DNA cytosine methyltransferase [Lachnospiraceae bacterium]
MTLGSLFDGISGFPLAAVRQGITPVWGSEIETDCIDISAKHFPDMKQLGDITKINGAEIPPVDIISFGSPCQNLSVAGNGKGLAGSESSLFFEAIRIIDEMRWATNGEYPKYAVWENVAGAFSSNKGRDFQKVLEEITKTAIPMPDSGRWAEAGMVRSRGGSTAWRMLDAQYWGVPQRRKRIFLVRDFRTDRAGQILFECESVLGYVAKGRGYEKGYAGQTADCASGGNSGGMAQDADGQLKLEFAEPEKKHTKLDFGRTGDRIYIDAKQSVTLMGRAGGGAAKTGCYLLPVYTIIGNVLGRKAGSGGNQTGVGQDISPTLTESDRHAVAAPEESWRQKYQVRSLTPTECERLDGFPDGWTQYGASGKEMSSNTRIKALGNSIAIPCAERVFRGIVAVDQEERKDG